MKEANGLLDILYTAFQAEEDGELHVALELLLRARVRLEKIISQVDSKAKSGA